VSENYIKSVELWNFENHEHLLIDGLTPGFNLIVGDSQAGKTSVVRAIMLVCFNVFEQQWVRVGAKTCEVDLTTCRGSVHVKRGKGVNEWRLKTTDGNVQEFEKIGARTVLSEVVDIVGMKAVELGDAVLNVSVMDQLGGHFLLEEMDGKKATGSFRAQVIDEISGLSGFETLVKDINLDSKRASKSVRDAEKTIEDINAKMHDEVMLTEERKLLEGVEKLIESYVECMEAVEAMRELFVDYEEVLRIEHEVECELDSLPNVDQAEVNLLSAEESLGVTEQASDVLIKSLSVAVSEVECETLLVKMPDLEIHGALLDEVGGEFETLTEFSDLVVDFAELERSCKAAEVELVGIPSAFPDDLIEADVDLVSASEMFGLFKELSSSNDAVNSATRALSSAVKSVKELSKEHDDFVATVEVCPLTLAPITAECLEKAKLVSEKF